ncbi:hypothetical protein MU852_06625 [Brevundimonas albigilva]|uniref:hypothetical protein n=1 Tax=Brevundimonas TaxID=41275 RepID=UPI00201B966D|nr:MULTISPECIES: hypothetical protein [Brevundimonas]UQV19448.1 hypothetical protein MU852_06625 [Brevundimonas albigilva]
MNQHNVIPATCPVHGSPRHRQKCSGCNAAYMRGYQRTSRRKRPVRALLDRAKQRARTQSASFSLRLDDICVPDVCPVLGIPLVIGGPRSDASPSLDRIEPDKGYVAGNVRVISDKANRLKGSRTLAEVEILSRSGRLARRKEFAAIARYLEREALLLDVKRKAREAGPDSPWAKIAEFLEAKFRRFLPVAK